MVDGTKLRKQSQKIPLRSLTLVQENLTMVEVRVYKEMRRDVYGDTTG